MHPNNLPDVISGVKDVKLKIFKHSNKKILPNGNDKWSTNEILKRCSESDINKVYTISLRCEKLLNFPNLNEFKHLKTLDASSNMINKCENLKDFKELNELKIFDNQLENLSGLNGLKELVVLQVQYNRITTIGPNALGTLRRLKQLRVDNNNLSEITMRDLSCCSNLTYLDVSFNKLTTISFISCLPNLEEFYATNNKLEVIPDLSRCSKLSELHLSDNSIENINGLKDHRFLSILDLSGNKISMISNLGCLKQLEFLNISKNQIRESVFVNMVTSFPNLEVLNIAENNLDDLSQSLSILGVLNNLCELVLRGNKFPVVNKESQEQYTLTEIGIELKQLRMIDNISLKKPESHPVNCQNSILMRPMTAASGLSLRQIESQLQGFTKDMFEIQSKTNAVYTEVLKSLSSIPENLKIDLTALENDANKLSSIKSSRTSRLKDALIFASVNYCDDL